jgi:hypothetical protein
MYTFMFVSPIGSIPVFDFATCPDDETACRTAEQLLGRHPERRAVEVWNERERVCVVERNAAGV